MPGIWTSSSAKSGRTAMAFASASGPSRAVTTSKPSSRRLISTKRRMSASSSATSTVAANPHPSLRSWVGSCPVLPERRRQHLLDRPAPTTSAEQDLDLDARPLRPPDEGERLAVPRELVVAVVPSRGQRSVVAGRPGMRQVHRRVHLSPLRVLAQGPVGLSFQRAPELLVRLGPLVGWGVRPRASLVGHIATSPPRRQ